MSSVSHPKASAGQDGATTTPWFIAVAEEVRAFLGRRGPTKTEAARILGRAAAEKRKRDNRTLEERKADKLAQMRAEKETGWPIPPSQVNKELAR